MHRSLVVLALLSFFAAAAPARAADVTLWACHGPSGGALGSVPIVTTGTLSGSCDAPGTALRAASLRVTAPADLVTVSLGRRAVGPGYSAVAASELERLDTEAVLDGVFSGAASGRSVVLSGGTIDLRSFALVVRDTTLPTAQVSGLTNRASGTLTLGVEAADTGVGLASVVATIDGAPAASAAFGVCAELSPEDATIDRVLGADCPASGQRSLAIDTTQFANGMHDLQIRTTDAAGNRQDFLWGFRIENAVATPSPSPSPTPSPSPSPSPTALPSPSPTPTPEGGILGGTATRYTTRDFLRIPSRPRASKTGKLTLTARCPLQQTCALRVNLTRAGTTLGSGRVTVRPGRTAKVVVQLTAKARRQLKRSRSLEVRISVAGYTGVVIRVRQ